MKFKFMMRKCLTTAAAATLDSQVKKWDSAAIYTLQACFRPECEVLTQANSLEEATDVVTDYISFCEALVVLAKTVKFFWILGLQKS